MKQIKLNKIFVILSLIGILSASLSVLRAQMVENNLTLPEEHTLNMPGLSMSYKIPKDFRKRGDLQNEVLSELSEEDIRSTKRLLEGVNMENRGSKGPLGLGYKSCFLRLGKDIRLKPKTIPEEIEKCSARLSMSIGRRSAYERPLKSLDVLYQNAPINPNIEYKFYNTEGHKLLAARLRSAVTLKKPIEYLAEDNIENTHYFYKILDTDTYLEISHEGPISKEELSDLLSTILGSIQLTSKGLTPNIVDTLDKSGGDVLKFLIRELKTYPTGAGDKTKLGEKIIVGELEDEYNGTYLLESYKLNFEIGNNDDTIPRPTYTYRKRSGELTKLEDKVLTMEYEYPENIQNLKTIKLKSLFEDGRIDNASTVGGRYIIGYTDENGVNRGIIVEDSTKTSAPPTDLPFF